MGNKKQKLGDFKTKPTAGKIKKIGASDEQQKFINYAWEISGHNLDFIATLDTENGLWDMKRQSNVVDKFGRYEPSYGYCQIHKGFHPEIVNDQKFFTDWKWQMDTCWRMYKGGVKFYGYYVRHNAKKNFVIENLLVEKETNHNL